MKTEVPFILAVTGHRDIPPAEEPRLKAAIGAILADLRKTMPDTPIRLFCMLASGADSLAAECAFQAGIEVVGILPFEESLYLQDFQTQLEKDHFMDLRSRCTEVHTLPPRPGRLQTGRRRHIRGSGNRGRAPRPVSNSKRHCARPPL